MAEIGPFRGWRYSAEAGKIEDITSPLFDLSENALLDNSYKVPNNINHLFLPRDPDQVGALTTSWKKEHILVQDKLPAIYVYTQSFRSKKDSRPKKITGFIANMQLHDWKDQVVLRHENILPHSVAHRTHIIQQTQMHFCPLHGLYTDPEQELETYLAESMKSKLYRFTDVQEVRHELSLIQDLDIIRKFTDCLRGKQIILADGHHRYEASWNLYRKSKHKEKVAGFHSVFLTNTESNELDIYATHRIIKELKGFEKDQIIYKLIDYFNVESVDDPYKLEDLLKGQHFTFGLVFRDTFLLIKLKQEALKELTWKFPEEIKALDLTVLHYFIIEKALGIEGKNQKNSENIDFSYNFTQTVTNVLTGAYQLGIITKEVTKEEIKKVCYSGYTLPHKSTYFFPKVLCGLVSATINPEEFRFEEKIYRNELKI